MISAGTLLDFTDSGVGDVNAVAEQVREDFVNRMGFGELRRPAGMSTERTGR